MSDGNTKSKDTGNEKRKKRVRKRRRRKSPASNERRLKKTTSALSEGELVGWLVSYGLDENGLAHELRSGRSLISSNNETNDRCTIEVSEASIASPHAALGSIDNHRLVVKDIFSQSGTYVRRANSKNEEIVQDATPLSHGDWIRFGDSIRFQICLIGK